MSPAANHLFTVRDPSLATPLPEEQARAFHHAAAQLLFLSTRARQDIQPATAFLTTQVRCPDEGNWGKVKRLLGYLKGTLHMPLVLLADLLTLLVVGGCSICSPPQLQGAYGCRNELHTGNGYELFLEAQDKHKELHRSVDSWGGQLIEIYPMGLLFHD
jgi:hypothetical protein